MILDTYAAYLTAMGIRFRKHDSISVLLPDTMVNVYLHSNIITLSDYVGLVNFVRPAKRLVKVLESRRPAYKIWPDKYSGYYEIEVEHRFPFTSIPALHQNVIEMAEMVASGYQIGKEIVGPEFCK